jgi:hypothetical protein
MSTAINTASLLKTIASLETQLRELTTAIAGAEGAPLMTTPAKKAKKMKDPDAPKKEANVWIKFTQRVGALLKAAASEDGADAEHFKGPATMVKEFCSMLKGQKSYDEWADSEVLEAFESWERPVHEPRAKKSPAGSAAASDSGSVSDGSKKERKKAAPKTEEQKAAIAAKRAATIASKKAEGAPVAQAEPEAPAPVAPAPVAPAPAAIVAPAPKMLKKTPAKVYTMEQLTAFEPISIQGEDYGVNERGDCVDSEFNFIGTYNTATKALNRSAKEPADWAAIKDATE